MPDAMDLGPAAHHREAYPMEEVLLPLMSLAGFESKKGEDMLFDPVCVCVCVFWG